MNQANNSKAKQELRKNAATLGALTWLTIISALTAIKYSPEFLNADILINSVMSLQNVTLYYWGQNRLLNILPLVASPIHDATYNLILVLYLSAATFFSLIFLIAKFINKIKDGADLESVKVFVTLSSLFVFIFDARAISEIALGHIEYSLPAFLTGLAIYLICFKKLEPYTRCAASGVLIVIAVGMNPSTLLVLLFMVFAAVVYSQKIRKDDVFVASVAILSFVSWTYVSKLHGSFSYSSFAFSQLSVGLDKVTSGLIGATNLPAIFFLIGFLFLWKVATLVLKINNGGARAPSERFVVLSILFFSICWLIIFSCSKWVEMNNFSWRYFIYIIFGALVIVGFELSSIFKIIGDRSSWILVVIFMMAATLSTYRTPVSFKNFKVFEKVHALSPVPHGLYAGDYWVVWPAVLRDLMQGRSSFGLTFRGKGNAATVAEYVLKEIEDKGNFSVLCLKDTPQNCSNQIQGVVGPVYLEDVLLRNDNVAELKFSKGASQSQLVYSKDLFSQLPGNAGVTDDGIRKTNGTSGYLFFGPYVPVKEGRYYLSVEGTSKYISSAMIDVVSSKGKVVHARFPLSSMTSGLIISQAKVQIPKNVVDLEIRLNVSEDDEVDVAGYQLIPAANN